MKYFKYNLIFIVLILNFFTIFSLDPLQELRIWDIVKNYHEEKTFLLSYPHSANTWMRYCLEYLTKRPTFHRDRFDRLNMPLAFKVNFEIDYNKPPIEKIHSMRLEDCRPKKHKLILLVRNPKEAIQRYEYQITYETLKKDKTQVYFTNIAIYDTWNPENRLLVYYEDLIEKFEETMRRVGDFLNEPLEDLDIFLRNYENHKNQALELYNLVLTPMDLTNLEERKLHGTSMTKGNDMLAHSKKMTPEYRKDVDAWIEQLYPEIWNKYLKDRYSEEKLDYIK